MAKRKAKPEEDNGSLLKFLVIIGAILLLAILCREPNTTARQPVSTLPPSRSTITYEITGTASRVSVTLSNAQGGTEQGEYYLPFRQEFKIGYGDFVYISAQNMGEQGSVTCRIYVDGVEVRESTSSGAYVIATCRGTANK